jgi:hypothetical protein
MTNKLAAVLLPLVIACTAEAPPKEPTKVYDFSGSELADLIQIQAPKTGIKAGLRGSIRSVQRELLGCYVAHGHGTRGTIALSLRLAGAPDGTIVESVDVGGDVTGDAFVDCIRDTAMRIEFAPMTEPGEWVVNYPFTVGA